ncbi:phosphotransferase [Candidatus Foliamicus sp.]
MKAGLRLAEYSELRGLKLIRRLAGGGGWNRTWLAARGEVRLVVRLDTPAVAALGLNRAGEIDALRVAQRLGLGPELVFSDVRRGVLVTRWLPGRALTRATLRRPRMLRSLGAMLRRLHEQTVPAGIAPLNLSRSFDHYVRMAGGVWARRAARQARQFLRRAAGGDRQPTLCHNDPVAQNILVSCTTSASTTPRTSCLADASSLRLIDWEFSAPGDPLFDLAVVIGHHALNAGEARTLLAAARGRAHPSEQRALQQLVSAYTMLRVVWEAAAAAAMNRSRHRARNPMSFPPATKSA